jgi:hypothetical protein
MPIGSVGSTKNKIINFEKLVQVPNYFKLSQDIQKDLNRIKNSTTTGSVGSTKNKIVTSEITPVSPNYNQMKEIILRKLKELQGI